MEYGWRRITVVLGLVLVSLPGAARAQGARPSEADRVAARALFDQARQLASEGKYQEACPKFKESARLDPGPGVIFNLANCYEQAGRTASAWMLFLEVASQMRAEEQAEREKAARVRAASLESKLYRVTIVVAKQSRIPGLLIVRDGTEVTEPMWGAPLPVDPGTHTIVASAPGHASWTHQFQVGAEPHMATVEVPPLEPAGAESSAAPALAARAAALPAANTKASQGASPSGELPSTSPTRRYAGLILGGVGVLGLGASGFIGLVAKSKYDDSSGQCANNVCTQEGLDARNEARATANAATAVGTIGAVALAAGVVLFLAAPSSGPKPQVALTAGPGMLGLKGGW